MSLCSVHNSKDIPNSAHSVPGGDRQNDWTLKYLYLICIMLCFCYTYINRNTISLRMFIKIIKSFTVTHFHILTSIDHLY